MKFDKEKYKVYTWRNWMILHWIINPGLAFNELILGQRVPKVSLEDKSSNKPRFESMFIPCPHCETIHDSRIWSYQNKTGFKNWFGLYCKNCGGIIPCLIGGLSFIILVLTFPIWGWFKESLKRNWLARQPKRFENLNIKEIPNPFSKNKWIKYGLAWGLYMFVFMTFILTFFGGEEITLKKILIAIPIWTIAGLVFGYTMKLFMNKKVKNTATNNV